MMEASLHTVQRELSVSMESGADVGSPSVKWLSIRAGSDRLTLFADNTQLAQIRDTISEYLGKQEVASA
jgi:hypothetical protein